MPVVACIQLWPSDGLGVNDTMTGVQYTENGEFAASQPTGKSAGGTFREWSSLRWGWRTFEGAVSPARLIRVVGIVLKLVMEADPMHPLKRVVVRGFDDCLSSAPPTNFLGCHPARLGSMACFAPAQ